MANDKLRKEIEKDILVFVKKRKKRKFNFSDLLSYLEKKKHKVRRQGLDEIMLRLIREDKVEIECYDEIEGSFICN